RDTAAFCPKGRLASDDVPSRPCTPSDSARNNQEQQRRSAIFPKGAFAPARLSPWTRLLEHESAEGNRYSPWPSRSTECAQSPGVVAQVPRRTQSVHRDDRCSCDGQRY